MTSCIPNYRPDLQDGRAHYTIYPRRTFAQAPFKYMGWQGVSLIASLVHGMSRRIKPYIPTIRSPKDPTCVWDGQRIPNYRPGSRDGQAHYTLHTRRALAQVTYKRMGWQAYP